MYFFGVVLQDSFGHYIGSKRSSSALNFRWLPEAPSASGTLWAEGAPARPDARHIVERLAVDLGSRFLSIVQSQKLSSLTKRADSDLAAK